MVRRILISLTLCSFLVGSLATMNGCYGSFAVTKKIHSWNGSVSGNKFVNTLIFWAFVIIPVYELLALGDAIIFNVIEFWTGSNPFGGGGASVETAADGSVHIRRGDLHYALTPVDNETVRITKNGTFVGFGRVTEDGGFALEDQKTGRTVHISKKEMLELEERYGEGSASL